MDYCVRKSSDFIIIKKHPNKLKNLDFFSLPTTL